MRFTHRLCRTEVDHLAQVARTKTEQVEKLTQQVESLTDDLQAAEHALEEVVQACQDLGYGLTDAAIPDALRDRLVDADGLPDVLHRLDQAQEENARLVREHTEQLERVLRAAREQGRLARTYALLEGSELGTRNGLAAWLLRIQITTWAGISSWGCQDTDCTRDTRELVWHPDAPEQAHLACSCGRVWSADRGAVERAELEARAHQRRGTTYKTSLRWSHMSHPLLEAIDRALPTPAECRQALDAA